MSDTLYTAAAGATVQQMRLEVLANNLANMNSVGFKEDRPIFSISHPEGEFDSAPGGPIPEAGDPSAAASSWPPVNVHVRMEGTLTNFDQGPVRQTGRPLDVALNGRGFFAVETAGGIRYTRNGSFSRSSDGLLVTSNGLPVQGTRGNINLEEGRVDISEDGTVSVDGSEVGQLKLVDFDDLRSLVKAGNDLFAAAQGGPGEKEAENATVHQGALEYANVSPVRALTEMIEVHRAYENQQKLIKNYDESTEKTINSLGTV
jgi:flagellar basal-body rod protein FlgF